jgi:hypothetical protein
LLRVFDRIDVIDESTQEGKVAGNKLLGGKNLDAVSFVGLDEFSILERIDKNIKRLDVAELTCPVELVISHRCDDRSGRAKLIVGNRQVGVERIKR